MSHTRLFYGREKMKEKVMILRVRDWKNRNWRDHNKLRKVRRRKKEILRGAPFFPAVHHDITINGRNGFGGNLNSFQKGIILMFSEIKMNNKKQKYGWQGSSWSEKFYIHKKSCKNLKTWLRQHLEEWAPSPISLKKGQNADVVEKWNSLQQIFCFCCFFWNTLEKS